MSLGVWLGGERFNRWQYPKPMKSDDFEYLSSGFCLMLWFIAYPVRKLSLSVYEVQFVWLTGVSIFCIKVITNFSKADMDDLINIRLSRGWFRYKDSRILN